MGHFDYLVLPYGLTNILAFSLWSTIPLGIFWTILYSYALTAYSFFSQDLIEHKRHVHGVLQKLIEKKISVKAKMCDFHVSTISLFRYIAEQGQLQMDTCKASAVVVWPTPAARKQLQFLSPVHSKWLTFSHGSRLPSYCFPGLLRFNLPTPSSKVSLPPHRFLFTLTPLASL